MKRSKAIELNAALNTAGLKVKFLTGAQYVSLIGIKRPLQKYLEEMGSDEKELADSHDILTTEQLNEKMFSDKSFREKMELIQSKGFTPKELNFIPADEFKKFTDEVDFSIGAVLAEHLLKEE